MALTTLAFSSELTRLETLPGVTLLDVSAINDLFKISVDESGSLSGFGFSGSYDFAFETGLQLNLQDTSLGAVQIDYPVLLDITVPMQVDEGAGFELSFDAAALEVVDETTSDETGISPATIAGESFNFDALTIDLFLRSEEARFTDVSLFNTSFGSLIDIDQPIVFRPIDVEAVLFEIAGGAVAGDLGGEAFSGISYEFSTPTGEEASAGLEVALTGSLEALELQIIETLASITINPLDLLSNFPSLAPLGYLSQSFETSFTASVGTIEAGISLALGATLVAPSISGGFGLVQDFTFTPGAIDVEVFFEGTRVDQGFLSTTFDLTAPLMASDPDLLDGTLDGEIHLDLGGTLDLNFRLAPVGTIALEVLSASGSIAVDGAESAASLGPAYETSLTAASDLGSFNLIDPVSLRLPDGFFEPVVVPFSIDLTGVIPPNTQPQVLDGSGAPYDPDAPLGVFAGSTSPLQFGTLRIVDEDTAGDLRVTLNVTSGTLTATGTASVDVSGAQTGTLVLTGTAEALTAYLSGASQVLFTPGAGATSATLTFTTDDLTGNPTFAMAELSIQSVAAGEIAPGVSIISGTFAGDYIEGETAQNAEDQTVNLPDALSGGGGNDTLIGDPVSLDPQSDRLFGGPGNDSLNGGGGTDILLGGDGQDTLTATDGATLLGGEGNDVLAGDGAGLLDGGPGDDALSGGTTARGGTGDDTLVGPGSLFGDDGNDSLQGSTLSDGNAGNDTVRGSGTLRGGEGNDLVTGDGALFGDEGDDTLEGGEGADRIAGGAGNDSIRADGERFLDKGDIDEVYAGSGEDTVEAELRIDQILYGGLGWDRLIVHTVTDAVALDQVITFDLLTGTVHSPGQDTLMTIGGFEALDLRLNGDALVIGSQAGDLIQIAALSADVSGGDGNDTIETGAGNDTLRGGAGNDLLRADEAETGGGGNLLEGGGGLDTLEAGRGNDTLNGGAGADEAQAGAGDDHVQADLDDRILDGGIGSDTLDFSAAETSGVLTVDLVRQPQLVTGAGTQMTIAGFENVIGRDGGADILRTAHVATGLGGADTIFEAVVADGGAGRDTYVFAPDHGPVTVNLGLFGDQAPEAVETLQGFENVVAGRGDDTLIAGPGANLLSGRDGNDQFLELGANDSVNGGAGFDMADYSGVGAGISLNLGDGALRSTAGGSAFVFGIEALVASQSGADDITGTDGQESLQGLGGHDTLRGEGGSDTLQGGQGDDWLDGGPGGDRIEGAEGDDTLLGGLGNDSLLAGAGDDSAFLGAGNDSAELGAGDDVLDAGDGRDNIQGGAGDDTIFAYGNTSDPGALLDDNIQAGAGHDFVSAGDGDDLIGGDEGNDTLVPGTGFDQVTGGSGADVFVLSAEGGTDFTDFNAAEDRIYIEGLTFADIEIVADFQGFAELRLPSGKRVFTESAVGDVTAAVFLGAGDPRLDAPAPPQVETLSGATSGSDVLRGDAGNNLVAGLGGDDRIFGQTGNDTLRAGSGDDTVFAGAGDDVLNGAHGRDTLYGGAGNDTTFAGSGEDRAFGGQGADQVGGGAGSDTLYGAAGADTLYGASGSDHLGGGDNADQVFAGTGADTLFGGAGNDTLFGTDGDDLLYGGPGQDTLGGGPGADRFYGGPGDDVIFGGADLVDGPDTVVIGVNSGADLFYGYNPQAGDRIDLTALDLADAAAALALARQDGAHVVFDFGAGHSLTVANVDLDDVANALLV